MLRKPPFKGPFKGKGAALRYLLDLEAEVGNVTGEMNRLVAAWRKHGGNDSGLRLVAHKQTQGVILRWRSANTAVFGKQRYLEIFGDECSEVILLLPPKAIEMLIGYEHQRSLLNAHARSVQASLREFRAYKAVVNMLEERFPELVKPPMHVIS